MPPEGIAATGQVDLLRLVDEVAERVGVAPPDVVLLDGHGRIRAWASRRRRLLVVGVPLLQCLTVDEVRALVAHELAVLDHRRAHLVTRLRDLHEDAVDPSFAALISDAPPSRRARAVLRVTQAFAVALERKADQAAASASGLHTAARAMVKADLADFEFTDLAFDLEEQARQRTGGCLQDLHDGWAAAVRCGAIRVELDDDTRAALMGRHPSLAGAISPLRVEHLRLAVQDALLVRLAPFEQPEARALALHALHRNGCRKWTTFAEVPQDAWTGWVVRQAREISDQAAMLLRREPTGPAEVVEILLTRLGEMVAANWPNQPDAPVDPDELDGTPSVVVVAEAELTRRGWRRVHPAAVGVLVSPDGEERNLHTLAQEAAADPGSLALLLGLLR